MNPVSEAGTSRVKPMGWRKGYCDDQVTIEQASTNDLFQVRQFEGKIWLDHRQKATEYPTVAAAKAAAQSIYEQRILSALIQPTPAETEGGELVGRLRHVLRDENDDRISADDYVAISEAASAIAGFTSEIGHLRQANDALIRERSSLIATKREQLAASEAQAATLSRQLEEAREALEEIANDTTHSDHWLQDRARRAKETVNTSTTAETARSFLSSALEPDVAAKVKDAFDIGLTRYMTTILPNEIARPLFEAMTAKETVVSHG